VQRAQWNGIVGSSLANMYDEDTRKRQLDEFWKEVEYPQKRAAREV